MWTQLFSAVPKEHIFHNCNIQFELRYESLLGQGGVEQNFHLNIICVDDSTDDLGSGESVLYGGGHVVRLYRWTLWTKQQLYKEMKSVKQNRKSTEGCSKSIVQENHDKFWKWISLTK